MAGDVLPLVEERPVVAVGQPVDVQTKDFAGAAHDVDAVTFNRGRRADAQVL